MSATICRVCKEQYPHPDHECQIAPTTNEGQEAMKEMLDLWWNTEPFGFDHPDTYNGILELMNEITAEARSRTIEDITAKLEHVWQEKIKELEKSADHWMKRYQEVFDLLNECELQRDSLRTKVSQSKQCMDADSKKIKELYSGHESAIDLADERLTEITRLKRIIARDLTEDDEIGSEYAYVVAMKEENCRLREALEKISSKYGTGDFFPNSGSDCSEIAYNALGGCLCRNGIRGKYCADYHVKSS